MKNEEYENAKYTVGMGKCLIEENFTSLLLTCSCIWGFFVTFQTQRADLLGNEFIVLEFKQGLYSMKAVIDSADS